MPVKPSSLSATAPAPAVHGALFELSNARGMRVAISERTAAPVSWIAPDRYGRMAQVLAYTDAPGLAAGARWRACAEDGGLALQLTGIDPVAAHGRSVLAQIDYRLDDEGRLTVDYEAVAGETMVAAPRFNLNGGVADVGDHMLRIDADHYLRSDAGAGAGSAAMARVGGTAFDFRRAAALGARLAWPEPQFAAGGGFDHRYCLPAPALRELACLLDPGSGRRLRVATSSLVLHLCTGRQLDGVVLAGVCRTGRVHRHTTVYRLSVQ